MGHRTGGQGDPVEDLDVASQLGTDLGSNTMRESLFEVDGGDGHCPALPLVPALGVEIHRFIVFCHMPCPCSQRSLMSPVHYFSHNSVSMASLWVGDTQRCSFASVPPQVWEGPLPLTVRAVLGSKCEDWVATGVLESPSL